MPSRYSRSSLSGLIPTTAYHGAHMQPVDAPAVQRWEGSGCLAFVHDLMAASQLPGEYIVCDVLVTDLPWQKGYETFNERAGVDDGRTYGTFMARISEIVESTSVPLWLITGKHALAKLPQPDAALFMQLNEDDAIAVGYRPGTEVERSYGVAPEFLHALSQHYDVVGDFCCGYGRTARVFLRAGKRAVVSDFNPQCIGYVAEAAPAWAAR
jgi:hypothetical protein